MWQGTLACTRQLERLCAPDVPEASGASLLDICCNLQERELRGAQFSKAIESSQPLKSSPSPAQTRCGSARLLRREGLQVMVRIPEQNCGFARSSDMVTRARKHRRRIDDSAGR